MSWTYGCTIDAKILSNLLNQIRELFIQLSSSTVVPTGYLIKMKYFIVRKQRSVRSIPYIKKSAGVTIKNHYIPQHTSSQNYCWDSLRARILTPIRNKFAWLKTENQRESGSNFSDLRRTAAREFFSQLNTARGTVLPTELAQGTVLHLIKSIASNLDAIRKQLVEIF